MTDLGRKEQRNAPSLPRQPLSQQPRYRQLAQTLISDIQTGRYPVGGLLPTEYALCEQFGASRFTVREAMKQLVQMGLVARHAGVGTRVQAAASQPIYRQEMQALSDLYQYTSDVNLHVGESERIEVDAALAEILRAKPGERWLRAEALRRMNGKSLPICFTELFIHPAFATVQGLHGPLSSPVYGLIEEQFGEHIGEVQQDIRASVLSTRLARLLRAKPRSPALLISRHYLNRRREVVEVAISTHPADRFTYGQSFKRSWKAAEGSVWPISV